MNDSKILRLPRSNSRRARRLRRAVRAGVIDQENMDSLYAHLLQKRTDSLSDDISFISCGNDHGDPNRTRLYVRRRSSRIDAPETASRKYEIGPDQKTEDSGGNEHFRYCTARRESGMVLAAFAMVGIRVIQKLRERNADCATYLFDSTQRFAACAHGSQSRNVNDAIRGACSKMLTSVFADFRIEKQKIRSHLRPRKIFTNTQELLDGRLLNVQGYVVKNE